MYDKVFFSLGKDYCSSGSVLGLMMFNIFVGDTDSRIKCTLSKLSDNTGLSGAADMPERWDDIQRDLDKVKK